ncbi:hypothetical protein [Burkholderia metallica]|uniref:hypothetical protein n=1 Tax=Burkholderia metallica TaxID=488729 RepID=UPI0018FEB511
MAAFTDHVTRKSLESPFSLFTKRYHRSQAVLRTLEMLGVPDSPIEAVSFGNAKPVASGYDDASRARNRRADIVHR